MSGATSRSRRRESNCKRFRVRSKGSASWNAPSSTAPSVSRMWNHPMSTSVPSALEAASSGVPRLKVTAKRAQTNAKRATKKRSAATAFQRMSFMASLRREPTVHVVQARGLDRLEPTRLLEPGPPRGAVLRHSPPSPDIEERKGDGPEQGGAEGDGVVVLGVREDREVPHLGPERRQVGPGDEEVPANRVEHRIEEEPDRREERPPEHPAAEAHVQHHEEDEDQRDLDGHQRDQPEGRAERDPPGDLIRRAVGVERFDGRLEDLEDREHRSFSAGR